jgi:hypothetical protein
MNCFKYSVGDLVKMYDCQEHKMFFGYITDLALDPKSNINMYEVYWFDEETAEFQPFSYHEEFSLQSHGVIDASIMG